MIMISSGCWYIEMKWMLESCYVGGGGGGCNVRGDIQCD